MFHIHKEGMTYKPSYFGWLVILSIICSFVVLGAHRWQIDDLRARIKALEGRVSHDYDFITDNVEWKKSQYIKNRLNSDREVLDTQMRLAIIDLRFRTEILEAKLCVSAPKHSKEPEIAK